MKVLHVAETIKGGVATVINELVNHQLKSENIDEINVLIPEPQADELTFTNGKIIKTFSRTGRNLKSFISLSKAFTKMVYINKPDIIHIHSTFAGFFCRLILIFSPWIKSKIVYCPHAFSFMMSTSYMKRRVFSFIEKILQFRTDKIICVSKYELEEAIRLGLDDKKLCLIYNGINNESQQKSLIPSSVKNTFTILFVGRFDYQKGFDILQEVIEKLADERIKFKLVGGYVNESETLKVKDLSTVDYYGWLPKEKIRDVYESANLLVIPSRWEGFAMVPLEAFRSKLPVLASDFPSLCEIVKEDETGFLFKNDDAQHLMEKIIEIFHLDNRDEVLSSLGENAYNIFEKSYTSDIMGDKVICLYLFLLDN